MEELKMKIDNRHIINPHVDRVNGDTQELSHFFDTLNQNHPLYEKYKDKIEELSKGILVINNDSEDPSIYIKDTNGDIVKISGNGSMTVDTAEEAISESTTNNIGQLIYIKEDSTFEGIDYSEGLYVVVEEHSLMKLAISTPSGDVSSDVAKLQGKVGIIENIVGKEKTDENEATGIFKKIDDVEDAINNIVIPDSPVKDIIVNNESIVDENGNAILILPETDLGDIDETIENIQNSLSAIDNYTVNHKPISTEGGVVINAEDILVNSIQVTNSGCGKMDVIVPQNSVEKSIEILQNNIAALTMAITASLNDFHEKIKQIEEEIEELKRTE